MSKKDNNVQLNRLSGRYEIIEQVGVGGMSYVYKAYDTKKKKIVAIKMLREELAIDEEFVNKFKSEALACIDIKHNNVIGAYDVVDEGNMHYIVMEYVDGTTLNKYIKNKGKLTNEETVNISLQVAKGIQAAHKKGIIHRDIKPQNIVINDKNIAKITDFGIARAITSTTKNISVIGTVHYISPEQVRNTKVDFRSDIYSFGCTMYEMITGVVPFEGDAPLDIIISHLRNNLQSPSLKNDKIYKSLEKIILKAARMLPSERYQNIEDMIKDLELALKDKEGTYIKDSTYDDDEEGKTVIITDEDMKVIKAVSEKYTNKQKYSKPSREALTPEQQAFYDKYIRDGAYKSHLLMRRLIFGAIIAVVLLLVLMFFIALDTRKTDDRNINNLATDSIIVDNIAKSINGLYIDFANNLVEGYDIKLNVVKEEFSDKYENGKIIKVVKDNTDVDKTIDVVVSLGPEVLDFTNTEELQATKWTDMLEKLRLRNLFYITSEINDNKVPRGNIIGVNKNKSSDEGTLVFTISKGSNVNVRTMPNLVGKPISEARELLEVNQLYVGEIKYVRNGSFNGNVVMDQSIKSGEDVEAGTSIDLTISAGMDGSEFTSSSVNVWRGQLNAKYIISKSNSPNYEDSGTIILQVRLAQNVNDGIVYKELIEAKEYKVGTILPLVFPQIEGEYGVGSGVVEVVDVEHDIVMNSYEVVFKP